jgi:twitching motility protein PilT
MEKKVLDRILTMAVKSGVSDIHFQAGSVPLFRYNGALMDVKYEVLNSKDTEAIARIMLKQERLHDYEEFVERDVSYGIEGAGRFRANIFKQRGTFAIVLRAIPVEARTFQNLNLPATLADIADLTRGLVLVTGATGNGKSTTLSAMIDHINRNRKVHIITIEDPIEFLYKNQKAVITQREIGEDTRTFRDALRTALRQDPDVVMVGEIRDGETFETALRAAETGHLVMSAIHTTDVEKTIGRVLGFYSAEEHMTVRYRLAENLGAILSLRLLPHKSGNGRVPALEVMRTTHTIQDCIKNPEKTDEIVAHMERGRSPYGMQTFDQHLLQLFQEGKITLQVAKAAASSASEFERLLTLEGA